VGASVRTLDPERALASALVVAGDKIAAVLDDPFVFACKALR
jgi:hypothetical protein